MTTNTTRAAVALIGLTALLGLPTPAATPKAQTASQPPQYLPLRLLGQQQPR